MIRLSVLFVIRDLLRSFMEFILYRSFVELNKGLVKHKIFGNKNAGVSRWKSMIKTFGP